MRPVIIEDKTVLDGKLFQVKKRKLLFGKKKKIHYDVFRLPTVIVFPLTKHDEVYLTREYRYLHEKEITESIAGHVNAGETSIQAAIRELREEGGIEAEQIEEFGRLEGGGSVVKSTVHFFLAEGLQFGVPDPEEDEEIHVFKIPLADAVREVMEGKIRNSGTAVGLLMLSRIRKTKIL